MPSLARSPTPCRSSQHSLCSTPRTIKSRVTFGQIFGATRSPCWTSPTISSQAPSLNPLLCTPPDLSTLITISSCKSCFFDCVFVSLFVYSFLPLQLLCGWHYAVCIAQEFKLCRLGHHLFVHHHWTCCGYELFLPTFALRVDVTHAHFPWLGFTVTVTGMNFIQVPVINASSPDWQSDLTCVIETGSGATINQQFVVPTWISTSQLICNLPAAPAGYATFYIGITSCVCWMSATLKTNCLIGFQGTKRVSTNTAAIQYYVLCNSGSYLPLLSSPFCQPCPEGMASAHCLGHASIAHCVPIHMQVATVLEGLHLPWPLRAICHPPSSHSYSTSALARWLAPEEAEGIDRFIFLNYSFSPTHSSCYFPSTIVNPRERDWRMVTPTSVMRLPAVPRVMLVSCAPIALRVTINAAMVAANVRRRLG